MWRYTSTVASFGDENVSSHSAIRRTELTANAQGTNLAGESRVTPFAFTATSTIEKIDVAMTIAGSEVTSIWARNSASRAALPPTNCEETAPAQMIAVTTADPDCDCEEMLTLLHSLLAVFPGYLTGYPQPHAR